MKGGDKMIINIPFPEPKFPWHNPFPCPGGPIFWIIKKIIKKGE
jgi:hypothetical protein